MGIRNFIYMFPDINKLDYENFLLEITNFNLDINRKINLSTINKILNNTEEISIEVSNKDIFFIICFATNEFNPCIIISWYKKMFNQLDTSSKEKFYHHLKKLVETSKCGYVIFFEESFSNFEDNFIEIDGERILENKTYYLGVEYNPIKYIWIKKTSKLPHGVALKKVKEIDNNFIVYEVI